MLLFPPNSPYQLSWIRELPRVFRISRRLDHHQPGKVGRARSGLLQPARHRGAVDQDPMRVDDIAGGACCHRRRKTPTMALAGTGIRGMWVEAVTMGSSQRRPRRGWWTGVPRLSISLWDRRRGLKRLSFRALPGGQPAACGSRGLNSIPVAIRPRSRTPRECRLWTSFGSDVRVRDIIAQMVWQWL